MSSTVHRTPRIAAVAVAGTLAAVAITATSSAITTTPTASTTASSTGSASSATTTGTAAAQNTAARTSTSASTSAPATSTSTTTVQAKSARRSADVTVATGSSKAARGAASTTKSMQSAARTNTAVITASPSSTSTAPKSTAPSTTAPSTTAPSTTAPDTTGVSSPTISTPGGTPSAVNTGVPVGTKLTVHNGDLTITTAGTVIDGLDVRGGIKVKAANVTIKNSIIRYRSGGFTDGIHSYSTGLKISDVEIAPTVASPNYNGVMGSGFTLTRANIHNVVDSVHIYGNDVLIQDSYLHGNTHFTNAPNWNGGGSHDDSIQIVKGSRITITRNNYSGAYNSGIQLTQDSGLVSNVTISKNLSDGGGCTINLAEKGRGPFQAIAITDNSFGAHQRVAKCAIIRPATTILSASGNTWAATGATVALSKG